MILKRKEITIDSVTNKISPPSRGGASFSSPGKGLCLVHACWVTQMSLTLWGPMNCSPPGSPVHGILQARILEWVAMPSSRGSAWPRDQTSISVSDISCTGRWVLWQPLAPGKPWTWWFPSKQKGGKGKSSNFSVEKPGKHHLNQPTLMIPMTSIDIMCPCYDVMGRTSPLWHSRPKSWVPVSFWEKKKKAPGKSKLRVIYRHLQKCQGCEKQGTTGKLSQIIEDAGETMTKCNVGS